MPRSALLGFLLWCAPGVAAQEPSVDGEFAPGTVEVDGRTYAFRRLAPLPQARTGAQPLVVFLHGAGERGTENLQQLAWLPRELAQPGNRRRFPCHVLAVQCPPGETWTGLAIGDAARDRLASPASPALRAVIAAIDRVLAEPGVDPARVYVTGLSMGGFGAWELAARLPDRFAALMPVCGGGDPGTVRRLVGLPTLVWHGADDLVVPARQSREMVDALRALGVSVDYRELEGIGHDAWQTAYRPDTGIAWLFAQDQRQQRRGDAAQLPVIPAIDDVVLQGGVFELPAGARCVCDRELHVIARLVLDALPIEAGRRPGVVTGSERRRGDLVLEIDPSLTAAFELHIGDVMRLVARDAKLLSRGAAVMSQALETWPGFRCPRGRLVRKTDYQPGTVVLAASPVPLPADTLVSAVRECWSFGADELRGEGFDRLAWLDDLARERVRSAAERHGVRLVGDTDVTAAPAAHRASFEPVAVDGRAPDLVTLLSTPLLDASGPVPFVLRLPPLGPDSLLPVLRTRLPAIAERADRAGRSVHVGSFTSRLGQLLRN